MCSCVCVCVCGVPIKRQQQQCVLFAHRDRRAKNNATNDVGGDDVLITHIYTK